MKTCILSVLSLLALAGCKTSYTWTSSVPEAMRSVCVPTFRNESNVTELGSVMTVQLLREIQREGTFRIAGHDDAALEIQGVVKASDANAISYNRRTVRHTEYVVKVKAEISVIDRRSGKVLINNRPYAADTAFVASGDTQTGTRDASGRAAERLAQQIVDDLTGLRF